MAMYQARDTFVAELKDGSALRVAKGEALHESHELVRLDRAGAGVLFQRMDTGEEAPPPKKTARAAAKAT